MRSQDYRVLSTTKIKAVYVLPLMNLTVGDQCSLTMFNIYIYDDSIVSLKYSTLSALQAYQVLNMYLSFKQLGYRIKYKFYQATAATSKNY